MSTPAHRHRMSTPKHRICEQNTASPAQNQTRVLSKHHHIINNLRLFPQKHTFSACIIENATRSTAQNTKYKANKQELSGAILTPRLSPPHRFRCAHAKKNAIPIYRTDMPDRNNKKRTFGRPLTGFQLKTCCKKHRIFASTLKQTGTYPKKNINIMRLFQRLFFYYRQNHLLFFHKTAPPPPDETL